MRLALVSVVVLAAAGPTLAWVFIDGPTAALFGAASLFIAACASAPIVFAVVTRRNDLRRIELEEAEEPRAGQVAGAGGGGRGTRGEEELRR